MKKELSTSVYTFETIIEHNGMYVDKTEYIYKLVKAMEGQFFLSRPRRFGKSLTLSTLKCIFSGQKELFKGLDIYDKPYDWKQYPIVHISMNTMPAKTPEYFQKRLCKTLDRIAGEFELELTAGDEAEKFEDLIYQLNQKKKARLWF